MRHYIGTPGSARASKLLLLGAGELGKEVVIEAQRLGLETIAVDRYAGAPAMQVAHRSYVIDMLDGSALRQIIQRENPQWVVPEIEAINTETLLDLESGGVNVVPTARATRLTMDREGIRRLAGEELELPTSPYAFVDNENQLRDAIGDIGFPCVIKPVMSSSGKGQAVIRGQDDIAEAWRYAQEGGRAGAGRCIVEGFIDFDYEITLLTVRHRDGTSFCEPIGHRQEDGDYRESWQPQPMSGKARQLAEEVALKITDALGGWGLFGVELFVKGEQVWFSEVSPRPHDTGLVTLISQDLSQFALHVRAILGLPIGNIRQHGPCASAVILRNAHGRGPVYRGVANALAEQDTQIRLFGKPELFGRRRLGVCLARASTLDGAVNKAKQAAAKVDVSV